MNRDTTGDRAGRISPQGTHTFQDIVSSLIQHPSLALLIKKVFEACSSNDIPLPDSAALEEAERNYITFGEFACTHGIPRAMHASSHTDVLMAALLTGLDQLKLNGPSSGRKGILRPTLTECETALSQRSSPSDFHPSENTLNNIYNRNSAYGLVSQTRKGPSSRLKDSSRQILREWFDSHYDRPYPTEAEKGELALRAGVSIKQVNVFFGNRRMRIKRKMMATPAAQGQSSVLDLSDGLSAQAKWKSVVVSKMHANPSEAPRAPYSGMQIRELHGSTHGNTSGCPRVVHHHSTSPPPFSPLLSSSSANRSLGQDASSPVLSVQSKPNNRQTGTHSKVSAFSFEYSTSILQAPTANSQDPKSLLHLWVQSHMSNPVLTKEEKMQIMKFSSLYLNHFNHSCF